MKQCLGILLVFWALVLCVSAQDTAPATAAVPADKASAAQDKPRIYVTDEPSNGGVAVAKGNSAVSTGESGPNARVVEIQADLIKVCPRVTVTNRQDMADFTLLFRRQSGRRSAMFAFGGLAGLALSAASKVDGASLFAANGDLVFATQQRTVENAIREVCNAIPLSVAHAPQQPPAAAQPASAPPKEPEQALAPIAPPPPPADAPPPATKTISVGQSRDEVMAIFGQPQKVVKLPNKEMLYYPDMKVTLVEAKVSNVE